jgi:hypothetical protein
MDAREPRGALRKERCDAGPRATEDVAQCIGRVATRDPSSTTSTWPLTAPRETTMSGLSCVGCSPFDRWFDFSPSS